MRALPFTAIFLGVLSAVLFVATLLLLLDTRSELDTTKIELGSVLAQREQLSLDLGTTKEQLTSTIAKNEILTADLKTTTEQLDSKKAENETLTTDLATNSDQLDSKIAKNETLTADLKTTTEQLTSQVAENETLTAEHQTLVLEVGELAEARDERDALLTQIASLNSQIGGLQSEITSLEERHEPLIVESYTAEFRCTGSMEPKITCLDSATWLSNFSPQDVVIGTVISFTPTAMQPEWFRPCGT